MLSAIISHPNCKCRRQQSPEQQRIFDNNFIRQFIQNIQCISVIVLCYYRNSPHRNSKYTIMLRWNRPPFLFLLCLLQENRKKKIFSSRFQSSFGFGFRIESDPKKEPFSIAGPAPARVCSTISTRNEGKCRQVYKEYERAINVISGETILAHGCCCVYALCTSYFIRRRGFYVYFAFGIMFAFATLLMKMSKSLSPK